MIAAAGDAVIAAAGDAGSPIPWWGWLIIAVVALAVLVYGTVGLYVLRFNRAIRREMAQVNRRSNDDRRPLF